MSLSSPRTWAAMSCLAASVLLTPSARAASFAENFDSVAALAGRGWSIVNNSTPGGSTSWFQGDANIFGAQAGAPDSYAAANFVGAGPGGDISTWLITPVFEMANGASFSFFTRTVDQAIAPDRLEVRLSTNGGSAFAGSGPAGIGDFSQLLLTVNPTLSLTDYPSTWTQYTVTLSGLGATTYGRLGFRYFVPNTNLNGDYIGIDTFATDATPAPEPASLGLLALGLAGGIGRRLTRRAGRNG